MTRCPDMLAFAFLAATCAALSPVIIVPGDGSNQLEAKLVDKPATPHWYCSKNADWYRIWLDATDLVATTDCWSDNIKLALNGSASRNMPGVSTRVPFFGSTEGFEELDPAIPFKGSAAFSAMVEALVKEGYERNSTLRGAPYDFRYSPDVDLPSVGDETPAFTSTYVAALKALVEETVDAQGARAVLISHSMGGLQTLYFLNAMTDAWKETYVEKWIMISAPLAGAAKELQLFASGNADGLPISSQSVREEQRTYDTNHWLYPTTGYAASPWDDVGAVVRTDAKNYTVADYASFFADVGFPEGVAVHERVLSLIPDPASAPGVAVECFYSTGVDTPFTFYYAGGDFDTDPVVTMADGDGTVNVDSLRVCEQWEGATVTTFVGVDHSDMIMNATVVAAVVSSVLKT